MPGRTSRSSVSVSKSQPTRKKHQKRTLEAYSIASRQNPERTKVRSHRLGEAEDDNAPRRKRQRLNDDNESDGDAPPASNARRLPQQQKKNVGKGGFVDGDDELGVDRGSDSEGHEWRMGVVGDEEDSEVDSEEAFGESDEERFEGWTFRGSANGTGSGRRRKGESIGEEDADGIDLDEGEDEDGEEEEDFGDEGVDLATMLDEDDKEEATPVQKTAVNGVEMDGRGGSSDSAETDEGDGDEDTGSDNDAPSEFSISDTDEGDPEKLLQLQDLVSSLQADEPTKSRRPQATDAHESSAPSEYGLTSSQKLTLADLLPSVTDPKLKKSLKLLTADAKPSKRSGIPDKVEAPLPKRQQDRLDRQAAFNMAKETLSRWVDTVKHNRRAEQLTFPLQDPNDEGPALQSLSRPSTKPFNELEATIQNILEESGLGKDGKSEEKQIQAQEELAMKRMPIEEVEARRAELRKQRHLLFAEEIRAKRIKKIKSKAYRRVHRKERERNTQAERDALAAAGVNMSDEEREQNERYRAEERMGSKHRESKWAKGVKKSGKAAWDEDARSGVTEMARRNEELRRRIEGKDVRNEDEDEDDTDIFSAESDEDDVDGGEGFGDRRLHRQLGKVSGVEVPEDGSKSKLGSMKFMQRAEAAKKAQNDETVEQMRKELAGEESLSEDEDEAPMGRRTFGPTPKSSNPVSQGSEKQSPDGLDFEPFPDDEGDDEENHDEEIRIITEQSQAANGFGVSRQKGTTSNVKKQQPQMSATQNQRLGGKKPRKNLDDKDTTMTNPWLDGPPKRQGKYAKASEVLLNLETPSSKENTLPNKETRTAEIAAPSDTVTWKTITLANGNAENDSDASSDSEQRTPFALRNRDLIKRAFAGDDVLATFAAEKHATIASEDTQITTTLLPGWGSWTGLGVSKKAARNPHPAAITTTVTTGVKPQDRKDRKADRVIINEKRVKKNVKYLATSLPHPFENRAQYERSLRAPVGPEWVTKEVFQERTRPRVVVRQGIVGAMERPVV